MTKQEIDKLRIDIALNLFGAVSVILNNQQLNIEDRRYIIEQLVIYYVSYYRYFANLQEGGCPPNTLNRISLKSKTAKSNIERYFVHLTDKNAPRTLNQLFPNENE